MSISARRFQRAYTSRQPVTSEISYRGSSALTPVTGTTASLTIPSTVKTGDGLILSLAFGASALSNDPPGWTATSSGTATSGQLTSRVLTRVAQAGDAGAQVTLSFTIGTKPAATITAYKGTYGSSASDNFIDVVNYTTNATSATHVTPSVTTTQVSDWVVSIVADRIGTGVPTSSWTIAGNTMRGASYNTGNGASTAAIADSAGIVPIGATPQRTFTSDITSTSGVAWTIALRAGTSGPGGGGDPDPDPQMYIGMGYSSDYTVMENLVGRQGVRRSYSTGMPSSFSSSSAGVDIGKRVSWHSMKPDVAQTASGAMDATITAFVNSIPSNHKCMLTFQHEPENPSKNINPATWRTATQRFYNLVKAARPDILVGPILMSWTFNPSSGRNPHDWNPGANYCDFFGIDTYQTYLFPPGGSPTVWRPSPTNEDVAFIDFLRVYVGGKPPAVGEIAAGVYRGPSGTGPNDFQKKVEWISSEVDYYQSHDAVAFCYFNTNINNDMSPLAMIEDDPLTTSYWTSLTASHQNGVV